MKRVVSFFTRVTERILPDAFVFSLLLTLVVFSAAWATTAFGIRELADFWGKDFWSLNAFAMQMIFVLITGHMLASTSLVKKILQFITGLIHNECMALVTLSLFSILASFINWGFGLIVSGILAIEMARKLGKVNFGLFLATAYSGFLVWHGGLSGSIPLKIAGSDEVMSKVFPELKIPLSQSIFGIENLLIIGALLIVLPLLALAMRTDEQQVIYYEEKPIETETHEKGVREFFEGSSFLNIIFFVIFGLVLLAPAPVDINRVNLIFLFLSLILHRTPRKFLKALKDSFGLASGIAIQFPFYAGLMGLMQHSGLADKISLLFVSVSTATTLPLLTFLSGGIVNFFVPSGGGQWVVQGPIMLKAAKELGVNPAKVTLALAWGDAWTNLVQPFWVLPLLSLANLKLKDIMSYCLIYLLVSGIVISGILLWF
jgi:short-chain fatty acids transporter